MKPQAVIFDFNGTISDDEPLLDRLFREVLADAGVELTSETYFAELSGLSDPEIVERALELGGVEADAARRDEFLRRKIDRYKEEVVREPTVREGVADFVRQVASRVPVAIASGAVREEVVFVLERAGLLELFPVIVTIDDVERGKPDPEGYLLALAKLDSHLPLDRSIVAGNVVAIEDSDSGVAAAKAAGMACVAISGPAYRGEPIEADLVVDGIDGGPVDEVLRVGT